MEQQSSDEPAKGGSRFSHRPSNYSAPPKTTLALRTHRARSVTRAVHNSAASVSAPNELPEDPHGSGSFLRGSSRRAGAAKRNLLPGKGIVPSVRKGTDKARDMNETQRVNVLDSLPVEVANMVINMQEYYATGVKELTGKLGGMEEEMEFVKEQNEELKRRLDMQFVILRQANKFMQNVRAGAYMGVERADVPTLVEEDEDEDGDVSMDMEVPPTPVVDRIPLRSTGRKAMRRRTRSDGNSSSRRGMKMQTRSMRREATEDTAAHSKDSKDKIQSRPSERLDLETTLEEASYRKNDLDHNGGGADDEGECEDEDDDDLKILVGAPRLQAVLRKSAWKAINDRQNDIDPDAEYCPGSPSESSSSSSSPSRTSSIRPLSPSTLPVTPCKTKSKPLSTSTPTTTSSSPSQTPRSRYSTPRHTTIPRYASGPPDRPFRFHRMGRTVLDVWNEYKHGKKGNHAIEYLEKKYATGWRTGTLQDIKYASNYVGVRQKVVGQVEEICEREGISAEEACRRLDERVDGRMQQLIAAVRKGDDPFRVIPKR